MNENRSGSPLPDGMSSGPPVGGFPSAARSCAIEAEQSTPSRARWSPELEHSVCISDSSGDSFGAPEAGEPGSLIVPRPTDTS